MAIMAFKIVELELELQTLRVINETLSRTQQLNPFIPPARPIGLLWL